MAAGRIEGIFAPIATLFAPDGELDLDGYVANLDWYCSSPLDGVVVMGSNAAPSGRVHSPENLAESRPLAAFRPDQTSRDGPLSAASTTLRRRPLTLEARRPGRAVPRGPPQRWRRAISLQVPCDSSST